ncbi:MAG: MarR family transcriptional regulator [Candidatus Saccharibacteria bacterium]|nr:MarR family transcriptional regulator [Candidatus Saccharibacteria bacterium]
MTQRTYQSGLLFTQAHKAVRVHIYRILEQYGLNPSYWALLSAAVNSEEGIRLASVARLMDVKAPLITVLADDLLEMGLINRVPHHTDKRAKLLVATAKGKKLSTEIESLLSNEISLLMDGVTPADAQAFQRTLEAIISNARDE